MPGRIVTIPVELDENQQGVIHQPPGSSLVMLSRDGDNLTAHVAVQGYSRGATEDHPVALVEADQEWPEGFDLYVNAGPVPVYDAGELTIAAYVQFLPPPVEETPPPDENLDDEIGYGNGG